MNADKYVHELEAALKDYRYTDIRPLTDQLDLSTLDLSHAKAALRLLRGKRQFGELEHAAGLFNLSGLSQPVIGRQWAQALLDQNRVTQGLKALETLATQTGHDPVEGPEIRGLMGRAHKQLFVNEGDPEHLRRSIEAYRPDWENRTGDYRWQGINIVALAARAERDHIDLKQRIDVGQMARTLLSDIEERGATGAWDYAVGLEASVALGEQARAFDWASKYVHHPGADSFEIGSTVRQLREIWQLDRTPIGQKLLPILEYAMLQREGASITPIEPGSGYDKTGFEAVYGPEGAVYMQWIDTLRDRCKAVARIVESSSGAPQGTGFLVAGDELHPGWGETPVLITNSHVVSVNPADQAPLRPLEATAEFTRLPNRPAIPVTGLRFSSPRAVLDVSVLELKAPAEATPLVPYPYLPEIPKENPEIQHIYVIGHPGGNELAVSLYDNALAEYQAPFIRYRSPTEPGNSGSPVFNRKLKPIAVHHRALDEKKLNEGVVLKEIQEAIS